MTPQDAGSMGWFAEHLWAVWAAVGLALAAAEMLTLDFALLMLAGGALAGGLVALVLPGMVWLQVVTAVVVAAGLLGIVRPQLRRRLGAGSGYRSSLQRLVGSTGTVTREVTATGGEVKVNSEAWSARTLPHGSPIPAGHEVEVYEVDGATLVVYPTRGGELLAD